MMNRRRKPPGFVRKPSRVLQPLGGFFLVGKSRRGDAPSMKPSAIADLRMRLLKRALRSYTMAEAIGVMEMTWHFAADNYPDGRIPLHAAPHLCAFLLRDFEDAVAELMIPIEDSGWGQIDDNFLVLADWEENMPQHLYERLRKQAYRAVSRDTDGHTPTLPPTSTHLTPTLPPPDSPPVPDKVVESGGLNGTRPGTSGEKREGGEGGGWVSGDCALGEGYVLGTEGAKPPKKKASKRPPVTADQVQVPPEMDYPQVRESLEEWLTYRRRTGRPYRDPTYVTKALADYINDPPGTFTAAVNYSIGQGYQGLFRAGQQRPTTGQTRTPPAANRFDLVERELGQ